MSWNRSPEDHLPDVRDGLTRLERVILFALHEAQKEWGDRPVPSATLYGRVVEHLNVSIPEFEHTLARLTGGGRAGRFRPPTAADAFGYGSDGAPAYTPASRAP